ncbi:EAL domain-containing protein [Cryobacterium tepidiphilum]|uniref:EAL domain-containing protein n=2 Tax=Cryobacterium tepidiphilum TaxID=2486026 RepID=A0A3M8LFF3_9MICO|nr:EAL domain-containing protein [Cryobacterium tepidiphilum]
MAYGIYQLLGSTPTSWALALTLIASVIICGPFRMHVGRVPGLPLLGVAITMLAIQPEEGSPGLGVPIWAVGLVISQTIAGRNLPQALYWAGLSSAVAFVFVAVQSGLATLGVPLLLSFLIATAVFYTLFLLGEFTRQRGRWGLDRRFGLSALSPYRVGFVVLVATVAATLVTYVGSSVIPGLDPDARLTPLVLLLTALLFYAVAQRTRFMSMERRLSAIVDAAIDLPRDDTGGGLAAALTSRALSIVEANDVELRGRAPEQNEIGAAVSLTPGVEQYVIASRKRGKAPFAPGDERALVALAHIASEAARIRHNVDTLEQRANTDPLTNLPNYRAFQEALVEANENRPYHEGIAVLFIDLDDFKKINDNRGHHAGDELLRTVADRLQAASGGGDFVSRIGGDEFVVILADLVSLAHAKESAERIVAEVSQPLVIDGHDLRPAVSAGLAFSSHRELDAQTLVVDADRAMLQVKRSRHHGGRGERSSVSIAAHRSTRTNDIVARAIRDNRLGLAFQPIVNIDEGTIWAFEALVRYVDPELGPISPPSLVARAKSLGLMNELTRQVVTKALHAAEEFHRLEPGIRCITVNIELGQISETELGPFIRDAARAHPDLSLCIELNEHSLRSVTADLRREAELMQQAGVTIALDDYGSDDSSVGALVRIPMDILKIDKGLIDDLDDVRQREVIKALQGFGDNLGFTTVVEGIETHSMVDVIVELGVRSAQGYYYGRPLSFARTVDRLRRWGTRAELD